jgi:phosphatidate cytidylyltransferase
MQSNLAQRLVSAAVLIPALLLVLFRAPPWIFVLVICSVGVLAAWELMAIVFEGHRWLAFCGAVATVIALLQMRYVQDAAVTSAVLMLLVMLQAIVGMIAFGKQPENFTRVVWLQMPPLYLGLPLATLALLHSQDQGAQWVVLALTLAFVGDTGAYFVGSMWGKRKLAVHISPNKTLEGALGGLAGSVLAGLVAHVWYLPDLPLTHAIVLGVVGGAAGQAGDLFESLIKRGFLVKDSGQLIPGHGGILDRIDAVIFTSAVTWLYVGWVR